MTESQTELLRRIEAFTFDEPGTRFTFAQRLARENGWSADRTRRAIAEYRRFLFLCMHAGSPVCPSEAVDQVWHLHLIFTRNYWEDLCQGLLGRPLHHGPTRGGAQENEKHFRMYEETLESYWRLFGEEPPADLWPSPRQRFGEAAQYVRVNRRTAWVIHKPRWMLGTLALGPWILTGCNAHGGSPLDYPGPSFLIFFLCLLGIAVVLVSAIKVWFRRGGRRWRADAEYLKDPYIVATLSDGANRAVIAALCELARRGLISVPAVAGVARIPATTALPGMHPFELALLEWMPPSIASLQEIRRSVQVETTAMRGALERGGLVLTVKAQGQFVLLIGLVVALVLLLGLVKIGVGLTRGKPVLILVILMSAIAAFVYFRRRVPFRTAPGDSTLSGLSWDSSNAIPRGKKLDAPDLAPGMLPMAVALYGLSVLKGTALEPVARALDPERKESSAAVGGDGCDSGGSDGCSGGGGGGSGCGGCGGGD